VRSSRQWRGCVAIDAATHWASFQQTLTDGNGDRDAPVQRSISVNLYAHIRNFMRPCHLAGCKKRQNVLRKVIKFIADEYDYVSNDRLCIARHRIFGGERTLDRELRMAVTRRGGTRKMTRSKALFGLLVVAVAGGAAASGIFGTERLANWIPPLKWLT